MIYTVGIEEEFRYFVRSGFSLEPVRWHEEYKWLSQVVGHDNYVYNPVVDGSDTLRFRYEEDLIAFKIRFGI